MVNLSDAMKNKKTKYGRIGLSSSGYYIVTSVKEGNCHKPLHRLIYEEKFGKIPDGYHIHHKDGNKLNNNIDNLECLSPSNHGKSHKHNIETRHNLSKMKIGTSRPTNSTGYYRVFTEKDKKYKQGFCYVYEVDTSRLDGKRIKKKIRRVNLSDLEKAVKEAGYEWKKIDE